MRIRKLFLTSGRFPDIKDSANNRVITSSRGVKPEWLTGVLRENGIAGGVRSVDVLLTKELPVSTVCRLAIDYEDAAAGPRTLFLKLSGPQTIDEDIGRKEVEFYQTVAPEMTCPTLVKCYDAAFSEQSNRAHVLLEDLFETHSQPEQKTAPTEEMSRSAVEAVAMAHAHWWDSPKLGTGIGTFFDEAWLEKFVENLNASVTRFLYVAEPTPGQRDAYRLMLDNAEQIWGRLTRGTNLTIAHGDLHWWNFLYPKDPTTHSVHLIDWHLWHIDLGARDLAFLLALGGFAEPRPSLENALLRVYHDTLAIDGYTWEMLIEDYRWSAIRNLNIPVIFWSQGKHESTWQTALRRAYDAYKRLDCAKLVSQ